MRRRQRLKYPLSLKRDPLWAEEKEYLRKFRLYVRRRLPVQYIYSHNGKQFLEGHSQPLAQEKPDPQRDDTFDNFDRKKFVQVPTERFYDERLEHSFRVGGPLRSKSKVGVATEPVEESREEAKARDSPAHALTRRYQSIRGQLEPIPIRNRSLTSSNRTDVVRERRLTKISKGSAHTK